jgi:hypothetical protein
MISKGANDWDSGFINACLGGHIELVKFMISKGANDWKSGLEGACFGGNMDIIKLMISKGADENIIEKFPKTYIKYNVLKISKCIITRQILYKYFPDELVRKILKII